MRLFEATLVAILSYFVIWPAQVQAASVDCVRLASYAAYLKTTGQRARFDKIVGQRVTSPDRPLSNRDKRFLKWHFGDFTRPNVLEALNLPRGPETLAPTRRKYSLLNLPKQILHLPWNIYMYPWRRFPMATYSTHLLGTMLAFPGYMFWTRQGGAEMFEEYISSPIYSAYESFMESGWSETQETILDEMKEMGFNLKDGGGVIQNLIPLSKSLESWPAQVSLSNSVTAFLSNQDVNLGSEQIILNYDVKGASHISKMKVTIEYQAKQFSGMKVDLTDEGGVGVRIQINEQSQYSHINRTHGREERERKLYTGLFEKKEFPTKPIRLLSEFKNVPPIPTDFEKTNPEVTKSPDVVVAVIDTGVDYNHPDLAQHLWRNPGENKFDEHGFFLGNDGKDSDGNGLVDDVIGYSFRENHNRPFDYAWGWLVGRYDHGTHVAGLASGSGTAKIKVMALRANLKKGEQVVRAIEYIRAHNKKYRGSPEAQVRVVNMSFGQSKDGFKEYEKAAKLMASSPEILFVAAAGNSKEAFEDRLFPSGYSIPNLISVGALDSSGETLTSWSAGDKMSVDIAAPGDGVVSTTPDGQREAKSGTSMASPKVAHVAAKAFLINPKLSGTQVRQILLDSAEKKPSLESSVRSGVLSEKKTVDAVKATLRK